MNKSGFMSMLGCALAFALSACGQNNEITKRWSVAGHMLRGQLMPLSKSKDFEFLKNGVFNNYDKGSLTVHGTYVVASDKKSVLLKGDGKSETFKIIKLKGNEFTMLFFGNGLDTIVCYAYGSDLAKKAERKTLAYENARMYWNEIDRSYSRLNAVFSAIIQSCIAESQKKNDAVIQFLKLSEAFQNFRFNTDNLFKEEITKGLLVADNLYKGAVQFTGYMDQHPELLTSPGCAANYTSNLPEIYKKIETNTAAFNKLYKIYTQDQ